MAKSDAVRGIQRRTPREAAAPADDFINAARGDDAADDPIAALRPAPAKRKGRTITFNLRLSEEQHAMLDEVAEATNQSKHQVCMTILLPSLRRAHERFVGGA